MHAAPGARLFLDAFEDDDVRVGGHTERQHEAGEARERQRHVEDQDRRVEERGVDAEPEDRDEPEEAVEDEQEERDEEQADERRASSPRSSESLPSVAEIAVWSSVTNLTGSAPVWSTSARSFASWMSPIPVICAFAGDTTGEAAVGVVDLRPRLDLAVEDDREVLRRVAGASRAASSSRVISSNRSLPLFVNSSETIGWFVRVSKSCRVPESFRSAPVICGTVGGSYLNR